MAEAAAHVIAANDAGVVVALRWRTGGSDEHHRRYQVLKLRDGLVFDMQDYLREPAALRAIGARR